ncbi:MAG: hypothetical protein IPK82_07000 [Polyangiaceae bacterium]|nr:hypothetical protein [Polyangiaceae bacterium]
MTVRPARSLWVIPLPATLHFDTTYPPNPPIEGPRFSPPSAKVQMVKFTGHEARFSPVNFTVFARFVMIGNNPKKS